MNSSNVQWNLICRFSWLFYLNRPIINPTAINLFYKLFLHVQGFFSEFPLAFSSYTLEKKPKKPNKIFGCFQPSVVVPNHRNFICCVCLPEYNKKQIFLLFFQELASSHSLSFFICSFILYKIVEQPWLKGAERIWSNLFPFVLFKHMEVHCSCIFFLLGEEEEALETFKTLILRD